MAGGGELLADYRGLSVTGLVEAIRVIPQSFSVLNRLVHAARSERPQALVVIDFPDFNFRLAAAVKKLGIPIIYYISPQLWAWRRSRMRVIKRLADRVGSFVRRTNLSNAGSGGIRRPSPGRSRARQHRKTSFCASSARRIHTNRRVAAVIRPNEVDRLSARDARAVQQIITQFPACVCPCARSLARYGLFF